MYSQDKCSKIKKRKSKKALSEIMGYVLLITFAFVIGIIVYEWMKTYVPQEDINCPDGTSLSILSYQLKDNMLTLQLGNNGDFDVGGYFIYATDSPDKELATIDLSKANTNDDSKLTPLGIKFGVLTGKDNSLGPGQNETDFYNITQVGGKIYSVEIIPIRWQTQNGKNLLVSCKDAEIKEQISETP